MARRSGPPLFELLGNVQGVPVSRPASGSVAPSEPRTGADRARPRSLIRSEETSGHQLEAMAEPTPETGPGRRSTLTLPTSALYAAAGLLLAVGVLGYAIGYETGRGSMQAELLDEMPDMRGPGEGRSPSGGARLGGTGPSVPESGFGTDLGMAGDALGDPAAEPSGGGDAPANSLPTGDSGADEGEAGATARVYHSVGGWRANDPRTPGTNYLALATLERGEAVEAVDVLGRAGVESVAVRVEGRGSGGNDLARYVVYSLGLAVPSGRYSAMAERRRSHERRVGEIGRRWAEDGGASAFDQPFWRRFDG